jgi:hypothetical protein
MKITENHHHGSQPLGCVLNPGSQVCAYAMLLLPAVETEAGFG